MIYIVLESFFLVLIVYFIFMLIFYKSKLDIEMMSMYECGYDIISSTRLVFSYRFFLISILFIIFDVEISLILPSPFLVSSALGVNIFYLFIFILILGLFYEYKYGSLDWLMNYNI